MTGRGGASAVERGALALLAPVVALAVALLPAASSAQLVAESDSAAVEDVHPQDTPEDRGLRIVSRDGRLRLRLLGSLRLQAIYDVDGLQSRNSFVTYDIPVGAPTDPRFEMHADQTRFGMEIERDMRRIGPAFGRIEGDFWDAENRQQRLRLRHAYVRAGGFTFGQTWTTFSDVSSLPLTVDFEGPNSAVTIRTAQVRWTRPLGDGALSFAAESPLPDVAEADSITITSQVVPDLVVRYRAGRGTGHVQIAGVFRQLTYRDTRNDLRYVPAWGVQASGALDLTEDAEAEFQVVYGAGISRYIGTLSGKGLDLTVNPDREKLEPLLAGGGYAAFSFAWSPALHSSFVFGLTAVDNRSYQPEDAYRISSYSAANLFWEPSDGFRVGAEALWGMRENKDGAEGTARRVQLGSFFDF
jgi:hypothetical protein